MGQVQGWSRVGAKAEKEENRGGEWSRSWEGAGEELGRSRAGAGYE